MKPIPRHVNNGSCDKCREILQDCTGIIRRWFGVAQATHPTLHASVGHRDAEAQEAAFKAGLTKAHFGQSPHNLLPSPACDVFFIINGEANYDQVRYQQIAKYLPSYLESGLHFPIPDGDHIQERDWKKYETQAQLPDKPSDTVNLDDLEAQINSLIGSS